MKLDLKYPVLVGEDFQRAIDDGGEVVLELVEYDNALGFAWLVFLVDAFNMKHQILLTRGKLKPMVIRSTHSITKFATKFGLAYVPRLPVPTPLCIDKT
ncbi:MAG: hypothetical protein COB08_005120 [Rhodobacteraceae bacterium]|nr:hypothetical protein [Paracoccaceae bacterium]